MSVNPIPTGSHTIAPNIIVKSVMKLYLSTNKLLALKKSCVYPCPMEKWFIVN